MRHVLFFPAAFCLGLIPLLAHAQETARAPAATGQPSAFERLRDAATVTQQLFEKANILTPAEIDALAIWHGIPEDNELLHKTRFPHSADLAAYAKARPWTMPLNASAWPKAEDAPALRQLLADRDPAIRALAVEALASLDLPEDAAHIAALLDDAADAPPALSGSSPKLAEGFRGQMLGRLGAAPGGDIVYGQSYYPRTVRTYAREGLKFLTGLRFDGKQPPQTFQEWAKVHDLGRDSLWYWQNRIFHENKGWRDEGPVLGATHAATLKEIRALTPEVEAKLLLAGGQSNSGIRMENPFAPFFVPADVTLHISRERILELLALKNVWPDVDLAAEVESRIRTRIVYLAPTVLPKEDWPAVRAAMAGMPQSNASSVLISRLLRAGGVADLNDVKTREGYLHAQFISQKDTYASEAFMREMMATNLDVHWPTLEQAFHAETQTSALPTFRAALIHELGAQPHSPVKLQLLLGIINDPRNDALFTQTRERFDSDSYRREAASAVNSFAGRELIPAAIVEALYQRPDVLKEFRGLANSIGPKKTGN